MGYEFIGRRPQALDAESLAELERLPHVARVIPIVLERVWYVGPRKGRKFVERVMPTVRKIYPFMIAGAYVMPMMHQSSLGALMLLSGHKRHILWQTPALPGFYLVQAGIVGMAFVMVAVHEFFRTGFL